MQNWLQFGKEYNLLFRCVNNNILMQNLLQFGKEYKLLFRCVNTNIITITMT